ncbi:BET1 Protein transport protein BET1 [Candida maltosa Xu316]
MTSRYSAAGGAHQRDLRTQLFSSPQVGLRTPSRTPSRTASPYDPTPTNTNNQAKYNESLLNTLESQNNDEMESMGSKIHMLKHLGEKMGIEINKSMKLNDDITNNFEKGKVTLKNTYNKMIVMSQRAGISWKMWLIVFVIFTLWFVYVWLF